MRHETYLRRRLHTMHLLHDAVSAMRSLAAHHFRVVRQSLPAAREYRNQIESVVAEVGIRQVPRPDTPGAMLVVASDLGLCGDYNSRVAHFAVSERARRQLGPTYTVGRRARPLLDRAGIVPVRAYDAPASLDGLLGLLLNLAQDLLEDFNAARMGSLYLVAAQFDGVGNFTPSCMRLLPIDPVKATAPLRCSPYLERAHLTAAAIREFFYISLYEVLLDGLAAEHGMRLTAAESALKWIDHSAEQTTRRLWAARTEAATQELLDIVAGNKQKHRNR